MRVILASASPRRAELLRSAGYEFETLPVDVDESVYPGEGPSAYVRRLAQGKSGAAMARLAQADVDRNPASGADLVVLGADTIVVVDGEILGKPRDEEDSRRMVEQLSGRAHLVLTGVSVRADGAETGRVEETIVWVARLNHQEIEWYVASGEGRDKAGAYAIQGLASRFIQRIEGSYSNVVGLPVAVVHELFCRLSVPGKQ